MKDSKTCAFNREGICQHKDAKGNPCWIDNGREDMCPAEALAKADKAAQEEDAGER